jgi:hypothetical protein
MLHAEHSNDLRHFRAKAKSCFSNFSNELTSLFYYLSFLNLNKKIIILTLDSKKFDSKL